jgi:hypothetical protein
MWDLFCSLTAACSIIWAAFGFGRPLWRLLHELGEAGDRDAAETALWSLTLGMLVGGLALTVLAETGVLHVLSVALLTLAGVVSAMLELACIAAGTKFRGLVRRGFDGLKRRILHAGWWSLPVGLAGVLLLVPLAGALSPPVDAELLQHYLEPPKQVLLAGGLGREAAPGALDLAQFWSLWALALEGPVAANLVHLCLAVLFVVATMTLARHWHEPPGDKLAALFAMTCPVALAQFGVASSGIAGDTLNHRGAARGRAWRAELVHAVRRHAGGNAGDRPGLCGAVPGGRRRDSDLGL